MQLADLFDDLQNSGLRGLEQIVQERVQESVSLEFKCKRDASSGAFEKEDKRNLGKTLSALSNSMGGLLVWGVECRKDQDQVDCASSLQPISGIERFYSEASVLTGEYLRPRNEGIRLATILHPDNSSVGFLLIGVGRSDRRPHRSDAPNDGHYYKRVGGSSYVMEHFDIEDAFRRKSVPELRLLHRIIPGGSGSAGGLHYTQLKVILSIKNMSMTSALYPFVEILNVSGADLDRYGLDGNGNVGLPLRPSFGTYLFGGGNDAAIHPGQSLDVTSLKIKVAGVTIRDSDRARNSMVAEFRDISSLGIQIEYRIGCTDAPTEHHFHAIPKEEMEHLLGKY